MRVNKTFLIGRKYGISIMMKNKREYENKSYFLHITFRTFNGQIDE